MHHVTAGQCLVVGALLLATTAAIVDARAGRIPNWLTLPVLAVAPFVHAFGKLHANGAFGIPGPYFAAIVSVVGAALCCLVPLVMFFLSWLGAGDVKLLAALGAVLTAHYALEVELSALVLAAVFVPMRLAYRGQLLATTWHTFHGLASTVLPSSRRRALPSEMFEGVRFAPFVLCGTLLVLLVHRTALSGPGLSP
jgi:prepilin peptidase CpaA